MVLASSRIVSSRLLSMRWSRCLAVSSTLATTVCTVLATASTASGIERNTSVTSAFVSPLGSVRTETTTTTTTSTTTATSATTGKMEEYDPVYPGTAVQRMLAVRERVASLTKEDLNGEWEDVRQKILWAGGLKHLPNVQPGMGYTGHSFNDYNHVDLTCMLERVSYNENDGSVKGIAIGNRLGNGIKIASLPELGEGGSWSTCAIGCNKDPPQDVAHIQFKSRIAFKLVWCPTASFDTFVLVDDEGDLLATGNPTGTLPSLRERQVNYKIVEGSKYARAANEVAKSTVG